MLKTEAGRLQAEASDQWAYYQAKGIKASVQEASRTTRVAAGKAPPPNVEESIQRYEAEQKEIEQAARELVSVPHCVLERPSIDQDG